MIVRTVDLCVGSKNSCNFIFIMIYYCLTLTEAAVSKIAPAEIKDGFVHVSIKHSKTHTVHGSSVFYR